MSQWVRAEADLARIQSKLVQLRIDGTLPPLPFNQVQCADLTDWDGDATNVEWRKVIGAVSELAQGTGGCAPRCTRRRLRSTRPS